MEVVVAVLKVVNVAVIILFGITGAGAVLTINPNAQDLVLLGALFGILFGVIAVGYLMVFLSMYETLKAIQSSLKASIRKEPHL